LRDALSWTGAAATDGYGWLLDDWNPQYHWSGLPEKPWKNHGNNMIWLWINTYFYTIFNGMN